MAAVIGISAGYTLGGHYYAEISEFVNGSRYESMIADSDEKIEKYVKNEFEGKDYTDIQVFTKVMLDMWRSIDGYQDPQLDIRGYLELDITQNGYGVCRNMASYVEKVLKEMGYNARAYAVYVDQNISENESENDSTDNQNFGERLISKYKEEVGNHEIVLVDIPEDNITLVVDPTDIDIGIYYQGEIYMFGLMEGEITDFRQAKHYSPSHYGQFSCLGEHLTDIYEEAKRSYREPAISIEEIVKKYGYDAIYGALDLFVREDALIKPLSQGFTQDEKNTDGGVDSSKNSIEKDDLEQDGSIL